MLGYLLIIAIIIICTIILHYSIKRDLKKHHESLRKYTSDLHVNILKRMLKKEYRKGVENEK